MRILKYIFLLLLLVAIAAVVFVATQRIDFELSKKQFINLPKNIVYNYVIDFRNWEEWISGDNKDVTFSYSSRTSGLGSRFSWEGGSDNGTVKTISSKDLEYISQNIIRKGSNSKVEWSFKDSVGGTVLILKMKGKMDFLTKVEAVLQGGPTKVVESLYENSLAKLNKAIVHELKTFQVNIGGIVHVPARFYLKQSIKSSVANLPRNTRVMMSNLDYFFKKNKIERTGKPFVIYTGFYPGAKAVGLSVCIPIKEEAFTAPGSDISSGKLESFIALQTKLTGDKSHLPQAWKESYAHISKNNLKVDPAGKHLEVFVVGNDSEKHLSKLITELYLPIFSQPAPAIPINPITTAQPSAAPQITADNL